MTPQRQMELVSLRTDEVKTKDLQRRKSPYKRKLVNMIVKRHCSQTWKSLGNKIERKKKKEKLMYKNDLAEDDWEESYKNQVKYMQMLVLEKRPKEMKYRGKKLS